MPFFVPSAQSQEHAESIYQAIAGNVDAPVGDERIETLTGNMKDSKWSPKW